MLAMQNDTRSWGSCSDDTIQRCLLYRRVETPVGHGNALPVPTVPTVRLFPTASPPIAFFFLKKHDFRSSHPWSQRIAKQRHDKCFNHSGKCEFQVSFAVLLRLRSSAMLTQRTLVAGYRRFGTAYRSQFQESNSLRRMKTWGPILSRNVENQLPTYAA